MSNPKLNCGEPLMKPIRNQLLLACAVFAAAIFLAPRPSQAISLTTQAGMSVDGTNFPIPLAFDDSTGQWGVGTLDSATHQFSGVQLSNNEFSAIINGQLNPDPLISYGISVTDFGAASTFGFFFSTPIVFPATPNTVNASIGGALTDVTGDGVSITPTLGPNVQVAGLAAPSTNMGVDVGPLNSHGVAAATVYSYGPFTAGPQPGPIGAWTSMSITLGFKLSGNGDIAVLTGLAQIVPEPSSVFLLGLGGVGLLAYDRRRRKVK
jgi:hypothetical protein